MNLIQLKEKTEEKKRIQRLIQKAELELTVEKTKLEELTLLLKKEHKSVQVWLRRFKRELADITIKELPEMSVQIDSFSKFADYFFDNLIFDWVVQSKINRSLESCQSVQFQVSKILSKLKSMDKNLLEKYNSTKDEFTNYIETN